jgi:branched-chain amino acid transport system permease protein
MSSILSPDFWSFVGVMAGIYTIFALGLQVQYGFAGLLNFGHVASMALGAYTMAILVVKTGINLWLAALLGIAVAVAGFLLVGLTTPRLRADYFAIVTIAFSEILRYVLINQPDLTGGPQGTIALAGPQQAATYNTQWESFIGQVESWLASLASRSVSRDIAMMLVIWPVALLLLAATQFIVRTPWGRTLRAIREDEDAAASLGKNPFARKLQALALGAALGACAGLFYAFEFSVFSPDDFEPLITFFAWVIVILGGTARIWAIPLGSAIFGLLFAGTRFFDFWPFASFDSAGRAYLRLIIIGLLLIGLMYFRPQGLLGRREEMLLE